MRDHRTQAPGTFNYWHVTSWGVASSVHKVVCSATIWINISCKVWGIRGRCSFSLRLFSRSIIANSLALMSVFHKTLCHYLQILFSMCVSSAIRLWYIVNTSRLVKLFPSFQIYVLLGWQPFLQNLKQVLHHGFTKNTHCSTGEKNKKKQT